MRKKSSELNSFVVPYEINYNDPIIIRTYINSREFFFMKNELNFIERVIQNCIFLNSVLYYTNEILITVSTVICNFPCIK